MKFVEFQSKGRGREARDFAKMVKDAASKQVLVHPTGVTTKPTKVLEQAQAEIKKQNLTEKVRAYIGRDEESGLYSVVLEPIKA